MSRGRIWQLITTLCVISAIISMFLDNVTTILLITPITIKLFERLGLNPVPVLPFIILNINIAGLSTLIGHPPNLLITGNAYVAQHHVSFLTYSMHMCIGVVIALVQTNIHLRIQCRNIDKLLMLPTNSNDELEIWQKSYQIIEHITDEGVNGMKQILLRKISSLQSDNLVGRSANDIKTFRSTLEYLKKTVSTNIYQIIKIFNYRCYSNEGLICFSVPNKRQRFAEKIRSNLAVHRCAVFHRVSTKHSADVVRMVCIYWCCFATSYSRV